MIPKRFIRIWIGGTKKIPAKFEQWWNEFHIMHPDYEFITITDLSLLNISPDIKNILDKTETCAGVADIVRIISLYQLGGIYIDTDVKPIKSFNNLINTDKPFLGKRSSKSFETAIMGAPKGHDSFRILIDELPTWFHNHEKRSASVQTGPAFVSSVLFGRDDITHLPVKTFYPYNGFGAPKRSDKIKMFESCNFPDEMIAAHFSNHRWGGKP